MRRICVFCGAYSGDNALYLAAAQATGAEIARRGYKLVYGGGHVGMMGAVADAALAAGGEVIGVMPNALVEKELAHQGLTEFYAVNSMHERKAMMATLSDAFVTLPGGFGTMDEFFEIVTWGQLGFHRKPICLLNVGGYFDPLIAFFNHTVEEGFVKAEHRNLILVDTDPTTLFERLKTYTPPVVVKWIDRNEI
jgi:uncharacterized protein (TIGR00730 family)